MFLNRSRLRSRCSLNIFDVVLLEKGHFSQQTSTHFMLSNNLHSEQLLNERLVGLSLYQYGALRKTLA